MFNLDRLVLTDPFNTETTLCSECRNVSLDRVANASTVVLLPELRYESLSLNLARHSIRQIAFNVTTHLRVVLAVLNRDYEQQTRFVAVLRSDAPATRNCE